VLYAHNLWSETELVADRTFQQSPGPHTSEQVANVKWQKLSPILAKLL